MVRFQLFNVTTCIIRSRDDVICNCIPVIVIMLQAREEKYYKMLLICGAMYTYYLHNCKFFFQFENYIIERWIHYILYAYFYAIYTNEYVTFLKLRFHTRLCHLCKCVGSNALRWFNKECVERVKYECWTMSLNYKYITYKSNQTCKIIRDSESVLWMNDK